MKLLSVIFALALARQAQAQCGWRLDGNECICMSSSNGSAMVPETAECCRDMGLTININVSALDAHSILRLAKVLTDYAKKCKVRRETRQTFKDCCKWLNKTSVIGHCR